MCTICTFRLLGKGLGWCGAHAGADVRKGWAYAHQGYAGALTDIKEEVAWGATGTCGGSGGWRTGMHMEWTQMRGTGTPGAGAPLPSTTPSASSAGGVAHHSSFTVQRSLLCFSQNGHGSAGGAGCCREGIRGIDWQWHDWKGIVHGPAHARTCVSSWFCNRL